MLLSLEGKTIDFSDLLARKKVDKVLGDILDYSAPCFKFEVISNKVDKFIYVPNLLSKKHTDIQVNLHKLFNQDRNEINKVAIVGKVTYGSGDRLCGVNRQSYTKTATDCVNVAFVETSRNEVCFGQQSFINNSYVIGEKGITGTITTSNPGIKNKMMYTSEQNDTITLCYRKLLAKECFRLMGFKDADYLALKNINVSESQIYKMAGNSIVVNVLEEIFKYVI
jgi:site-specific DNA-cytosine methylase